MHSQNAQSITAKTDCSSPGNPSFEKLAPFQILPDIELYGSPYISCNEQNQQQTLSSICEKLAVITQSSKKLHMGFSLWFNLDLVAETKPDIAIIFDINPNVFFVYGILKLALISSTSPKMFIDQFFKLLIEDKRDLLQFPKDLQEQKLQEELNKSYGFLASQENFEYVKSLCASDSIFFGMADMTNADHMKLLANWCSENNLIVSTLYLSNIPEWIHDNSAKAQMDSLKQNITPLVDKNTIVIDAFYPTVAKSDFGPPQRVTVGALPAYQKLTVPSRTTSLPEFGSSVRRTLFPTSPLKRSVTFSAPAAIKELGIFNGKSINKAETETPDKQQKSSAPTKKIRLTSFKTLSSFSEKS